MLLRTRLAILVVGSLLAISAVFGFIQWQREVRFDQRYNSSLILGQKVAWSKIVARNIALLNEVSAQVSADRDLRAGVARGDKGSYTYLLDRYVQQNPGLRIDLFTPAGASLYTSSVEVNQGSLLEPSSIASVAKGGPPVEGIGQLDAKHFILLNARDLGPKSQSMGVLVLGMEVKDALSELKKNFGADAFLLNLYGRLTEGTDPELWATAALEPSLRTEGVVHGKVRGKTFLAASQPLISPQGKTIGAVVTVRDTTAESESDQAFTLIWLALGIGFAILVAAGLFAYLRGALNPLNRAVDVLDALAKGDTSARLPEEDDEAKDEAGHIAQGVAALRDEMVNLGMLRDERIRQNRRQEQLIRKQLVILAGTLDQSQRDMIVADLEDALQAARDGKGNQLATLSHFLGQMSSLITAQHKHLLELIEEVKAAAETKAKYAGLQQELEIARSMQLSILPSKFPARPEVDLAATMIPAKEVGGDFYDYFMLDDTHLALVVADVSGKGVAAAFFMAIARTLLQATARFLAKPAECIERLNDRLSAENEQMMFVTTFYGVLDLQTGAFEYVNAGHNPPIRWGADSSVETLPGTQGIALAVADDMQFGDCTVYLKPGDTLILFTDGVTEANDVDEVLFGDNRLQNVVRSLPVGGLVGEIPGRIVDAINVFAGKAPQADDITCLAVRYFGVAERS